MTSDQTFSPSSLWQTMFNHGLVFELFNFCGMIKENVQMVDENYKNCFFTAVAVKILIFDFARKP